MDLVKLGSVTWISSCLCVQNNKIIMYLCTLILLSSDDCADKIFASAFRDQFTKGLIRKEFINKFKKKNKRKRKTRDMHVLCTLTVHLLLWSDVILVIVIFLDPHRLWTHITTCLKLGTWKQYFSNKHELLWVGKYNTNLTSMLYS